MFTKGTNLCKINKKKRRRENLCKMTKFRVDTEFIKSKIKKKEKQKKARFNIRF